LNYTKTAFLLELSGKIAFLLAFDFFKAKQVWKPNLATQAADGKAASMAFPDRRQGTTESAHTSTHIVRN
jgi:hypothetical protein